MNEKKDKSWELLKLFESMQSVWCSCVRREEVKEEREKDKRRRKMKIEVFGPGCHRCQQVEKAVRDALVEINVGAEIEKVKDIAKIVEAGIMHTPGLRINGKIKCSGRIPTTEEAKKWIEEEK